MPIGRVCSRYMATIAPEGTVEEAASHMARLGIDTLVVVNETSEAVGVVTDRDLVVRCLARGAPPRETFVAEIMTEPVPPDLAFRLAGLDDTADERDPSGRVVRRDAYETLPSLLAIDDALHLLDREMGRGYGAGGEEPRPRETDKAGGGPEGGANGVAHPPSTPPARSPASDRRRRTRGASSDRRPRTWE
jgi:hypothetical protein